MRYEFDDENVFNDILEPLNYKSKNEIIYGFDEEIKTLIKLLQKYKKPNVIITGKAGVGKTALVEKLAQLIAKGKVPSQLKNKYIYELSLNKTVSGTTYRGDFEKKVEKIIERARGREIILFIDEIHNIMGLGGSESNGAMSMSEALKPYLSRNEISIIGATTELEYKKYIKRDTAFTRRFSKMEIKEPKPNVVNSILNESKKLYEKHYKVKLNDEDLKEIVKRAKKRKGTFPDKAFDELEDFCYELSQKNN